MWLILKAFWPQILMGVVIACAIGYVGFLKIEVSHYKSSAAKWEQKYIEYKGNAESMQAALKSSNAALTLQAKESSIAKQKEINDLKVSITKRVAADEASKHVIVPDSTVRVFNDSTIEPSTGGTASTDSVHVGETQEAITLNQFLGVATSNNIEHLSCIKQVEEWQVFWQKYVDNVKAAKALGDSRSGSP